MLLALSSPHPQEFGKNLFRQHAVLPQAEKAIVRQAQSGLHPGLVAR